MIRCRIRCFSPDTRPAPSLPWCQIMKIASMPSCTSGCGRLISVPTVGRQRAGNIDEHLRIERTTSPGCDVTESPKLEGGCTWSSNIICYPTHIIHGKWRSQWQLIGIVAPRVAMARSVQVLTDPTNQHHANVSFGFPCKRRPFQMSVFFRV